MQRISFEKTAALIVAAGRPAGPGFDPTQKLGEISILERIIATFQKSGIHEIVVITGFAAKKLEQHLAHTRTIFLRNDTWRNSDMLASAKIGFSYLKDKCEQLLFTPIHVPMFSVDTVKQLLSINHSACFPVIDGKAGHPLLLKASILEELLNYNGADGLRGALTLIEDVVPVEVTDNGILFNLQNAELSHEILSSYLRQPITPALNLSLTREKIFFNEETGLLLKLISRTHSVRLACQQMNLSYSQGWHLLNQLERQLDSQVIERHQGGKDGGWSTLTEYGTVLLDRYTLLYRQLELIANIKFKEFFSDILP